jgi:hypothetical protein
LLSSLAFDWLDVCDVVALIDLHGHLTLHWDQSRWRCGAL